MVCYCCRKAKESSSRIAGSIIYSVINDQKEALVKSLLDAELLNATDTFTVLDQEKTTMDLAKTGSEAIQDMLSEAVKRETTRLEYDLRQHRIKTLQVSRQELEAGTHVKFSYSVHCSVTPWIK